MPQLGETVTEGTIIRWLKKVGDEVAHDEPLFEVSTDKVDSEVPSPASGYLTEILVPEGETVDVGTKLALVSEEAPSGAASGTAAAAPAPAGRRPTPAPAAPPAAAPPRRRRPPLRLRPPHRRPRPSRLRLLPPAPPPPPAAAAPPAPLLRLRPPLQGRHPNPGAGEASRTGTGASSCRPSSGSW